MAAVVPFIPYIIAGATAVFKGVTGSETAHDNQQIAKTMGRREAAVGALKAEQLRRRNRLLTGRQVASFGSSGVDLSGSPLDLMASDAQQAELDALNAQYEGMAKRSYYNTEANQYAQQGKQAWAGSLLGGAAQMFGFKSDVGSSFPSIQPGGATSSAVSAADSGAPMGYYT